MTYFTGLEVSFRNYLKLPGGSGVSVVSTTTTISLIENAVAVDSEA